MILEDFYVHVRTVRSRSRGGVVSKDSVYVKLKSFYLNDYVSSVEKINTKSDGINSTQFLVEANIKNLAEDQSMLLTCVHYRQNKVNFSIPTLLMI